MKVLQPVPIPSQPFTRTIGIIGMYLDEKEIRQHSLYVTLKALIIFLVIEIKHLPIRFNGLPIFIQVIKKAIIILWEQEPRNRRELSINVPSTCMVFASL
jgi:hypothetical protein